MKRLNLCIMIEDDLHAGITARFPRRGQFATFVRQAAAKAVGIANVNTDAPDAEDDGARAAGIISLRVYPDQKRALIREAKRYGIGVSMWVRALIDQQLNGPLTLRPDDTKELSALREQLRRVGVNLNMLAIDVKRSIAKGRVPNVEVKTIEALTARVSEVERGIGNLTAGRRAYWSGE